MTLETIMKILIICFGLLIFAMGYCAGTLFAG